MEDKKRNILSAENSSAGAEYSDNGEERRKKKRAKKLGRLAAMLAVCAALAVTYAVVSPLLSEDNSQSDDTGDTAIISVTSYDDDNTRYISYTDSDGKTVNLIFDTASSTWLYADDTDYPINQTTAAAMAVAASSVSAVRELTAPESEDSYGLDSPILTVSVTFSDDSTVTYKVGDYNSYSQTYYMSVTGSDSVFAIESSFKTKFNYTLDDLIVLESLPSGELTIKEYTVTMPDGTENLYSDENLLTLFDDLELTGWADYKPSDEEITVYGLDSSSAVKMVVNYDEAKSIDTEENSDISNASVSVSGTYTLTVGGYVLDENGENSSSQRYLFYGDSPIVYKADSSILDALISGIADSSETDEAESE